MRAVALVLALVGPLPLSAHDGVHSPDVLATINAAFVSGDRVTVHLVLTGLGGPLVLTGFGAQGANAVPINPVCVDFAQDVPLEAALDFSGGVPGVFTLMLHFGPVGQGGVVVIPTAGPAED